MLKPFGSVSTWVFVKSFGRCQLSISTMKVTRVVNNMIENQVRVMPEVIYYVPNFKRVRPRENIIPSPSICRCLFGQADPVSLQKMVNEQNEKNRERMLRVWGFDVATETFVSEPRGADFRRSSRKWQKVRDRAAAHADEDDIENRYASSSERLMNPECSARITPSDNVEASDSRKPFGDVGNSVLSQRRLSLKKNLFPENLDQKKSFRSHHKKPYSRQLQITDFWPVRKSGVHSDGISAKKSPSKSPSASPKALATSQVQN